MKVNLETVMNNASKDNIIGYLKSLLEEYKALKPDNIEDYIEYLHSVMYGIIRMVNEYEKEELGERTNLFCITHNDIWLLVCLYTFSLDENSFEPILENIINIYENEWIDKKGYKLSDEIVNNLINLAEERYELISILENSEFLFYIFDIPWQNKLSDLTYDELNTSIGSIFIFQLYTSKTKNNQLPYLFACILGMCLYNYINEINKQLINDFKKQFNISKDNVFDYFREAFAVSLLRYTEFDVKCIDVHTKEKYLRYFENLISKLHKNEMITSNDLCPCGSGKNYGNCCGKKKFKWLKRDCKIVKSQSISNLLTESFDDVQKDFVENFGRRPYSYEKIFELYSTLDFSYENIFSKLLNEENFDPALIYATIKTGMFCSEYNIDKFSDLDLKEWQDAIDEFKDINNKKVKNNMSIFDLVKETNAQMKDINIYLNKCTAVLNKFLNQMSDIYKFQGLSVKTQKDFAVVCARKIIIDGGILEHGLSNESVEEVTNITRIIYEDLIQTSIFLSNDELFKQKILPLSLLEDGTLEYTKNTEGKNSKNILINPKTKEKFNIQINIRDLSLKSKKYEFFYDRIFDGLSSFIHLNISKTPRYFKLSNPLLGVQEYKNVGIIGLFLLNQCVYELGKNIKIDFLLLRDIEYIYNVNCKYIRECIEQLLLLEPDNDVYIEIINIIDNCLDSIDDDNVICLID